MHNVLYTIAFQSYSEAAYAGGDDLDFMTMNGWTQFCHECDLADAKSKYCRRSDLDMIFKQIDMLASKDDAEQKALARQQGGKAAVSDSDAGAKKNALGRVEFVAALVVVAINKYVRSGALADVSEAVDRLFTDQIVRKLGPKLPVPDDLRGKHLYTQEVAEVLESHEASLRLIFNTLAEMDRPRNLLSFHMWKTFLRALGFIGVDVTERDATLCFMWSVMAVIDNSTRTGSIKEKNLPFEGFLEALCRIATLKSLPYDSEIDQVGCADAGTYMSWFRRTDFAAYTKMVKDRACEWGEVPDQPMHRCVDHVVEIMIRTIEHSDDGGGGNVQISQHEMRQWIKQSMKL